MSQVLREFLEHNRDRKAFLEHEVKGLLTKMGLSVPGGLFIPRGAAIPPLKLSFPLVLKVSSGRIASKSDVRGVVTGIGNQEELAEAAERLLAIGEAEGLLIEEAAPPGVEVIIGGVIDRQFGPVVMFGLGGIFVELFKDVSFGLAPMTENEALRLVKEVKGFRLLEGYRGHRPIDMGSLLKAVVAVSEIIGSGLVEEVDLNPVALYPEGAMVLDAKMKALPPSP